MDITLVFIPCHMGSATVFKEQIAHLETRYPVHVADTFSHDTIQGMAEAALSHVSGQIIPIGLSMGGYVSMEMAHLAPQRLSGLVIMDSNPYAESEHRRKQRLAEYNLIHRGRYAGITRAGVKQMISADNFKNANLVEQIMVMIKQAGQAIYEAQMKAIISRQDYMATLENLLCPSLILYGSEDSVTPPKWHHDMASVIPQADLIEIPNAGHLITMEAPDQVTAHLSQFLDSIKYQASP